MKSIDGRLAEQNLYLKRLADHFAPVFQTDPVSSAEASVDFLNTVEASLVMDYVERTQQDTGRPPTDEEILRYLADEATQSLAERLDA